MLFCDRTFFWTVFTLFLLIGVEEILSARGGRYGGSYRSTSIRTSSGSGYRASSTNVRYTSHSTRVRVRYSSGYRPWRSWHSYGSTGHIYGYYYYTGHRHHHHYQEKEPTICRNEYDNLMDNGTTYEWFICPNITNTDSYHYCCGDEDRQYCCRFQDDGGRLFGTLAGVFCFFLIIFVCIYCCCCRKTVGKETFFHERVWSKRTTRRVPNVQYRSNVTGTNENTHLVNPPMQGPTPAFPQNDQPIYPPQPQPIYPPQPQPIYPPMPQPDGTYPSAAPSGPMYNPYATDGSQPYPGGVNQPPYPTGGPNPPPYPPGDPNQLPYSVQPPPMDVYPPPAYPPYPPGPETGYAPSSNPPYPPGGPAPYPAMPAPGPGLYNPVSPPPPYAGIN